MGAELSTSGNTVKNAEKNLENLNSDLSFQLAQAAVDVAGIIDPTPISDVVGAGMSLYTGDFVGAGLSLISIIPYVGDALGKTAKGVKTAKKINNLKKRIEAAIAATNLAKKAARSKASAAIRAKRAAAAAKKAADAKKIKGCKPPSNRFGTKLPKKDGKWSNPNDPGNSDWIPDPKTTRGKAVLKVTGGKPVKFKDGYPDFSPYAKKKVEIDMQGDHYYDFKKANKEAGFGDTSHPPEGMTWHHHEDGVTMLLVPKDLNNQVSHTGGASIVKDSGY
jgi:hypothetical protein